MSDQDPRVRELTYRLMAMAPDAPPFPQEATPMTVAEKKQRPPMLVWAAAAAVVVLLVGLPLFLFRGGENGTSDDDDVATTIAAPTTAPSTTAPPTTVEPGSTPTTQGSTVVPPTSGDCRQDWEQLDGVSSEGWYVFYACDRPGMENVLIPSNRSLPSGVIADDIGSALLAQLEGPSGRLRDAGYSAFSVDDFAVQDDGSPDPVVLNVSLPGDLRVDFTDFRFDQGMANASASAASSQLIAQLSSAVFQFGEVETVTFTFGGDCDAFWNWLQRDCTVLTRAEWENGEITSSVATWLAGDHEAPPTTTEPPTATDTTVLPGEPFDIGPVEGDVVAVVGVAYDDVLWLRQGPGVGYEPLLGLDPLVDDAVATGRHRLLEDSIWHEITADGVTGWVNSRFVGYLGSVDDVTAAIVANLGGIAEAATMDELGRMVAVPYASSEPGQRRVVSVAPVVGDLAEMTVDVIGLADDSVFGVRLHLFAQPTESGFSLQSVEQTSICGRGVTDDGLCV